MEAVSGVEVKAMPKAESTNEGSKSRQWVARTPNDTRIGRETLDPIIEGLSNEVQSKTERVRTRSQTVCHMSTFPSCPCLGPGPNANDDGARALEDDAQATSRAQIGTRNRGIWDTRELVAARRQMRVREALLCLVRYPVGLATQTPWMRARGTTGRRTAFCDCTATAALRLRWWHTPCCPGSAGRDSH
jgi:hypothetical protein